MTRFGRMLRGFLLTLASSLLIGASMRFQILIYAIIVFFGAFVALPLLLKSEVSSRRTVGICLLIALLAGSSLGFCWDEMGLPKPKVAISS